MEISVPQMDLLLETLVFEPGRTINSSSFLPFRFRVEANQQLEIRKAKFRVMSVTNASIALKIEGMSVRAEEFGFWLRLHSGILRFVDEGIASFSLDERGIDIQMEIDIAKETLENMVTLRSVKVIVHKLNYTLRKSKISWLAWLAKPIIRPIVRKIMENRMAALLSDGIHNLNRELLYARERIRATNISDPQDIRTFIKAIVTRFTPESDPDLYANVGVSPREGVFKGIFAPGSVVRVWEMEGRRAGERIDESSLQAWRNEIFDTPTIVP